MSKITASNVAIANRRARLVGRNRWRANEQSRKLAAITVAVLGTLSLIGTLDTPLRDLVHGLRPLFGLVGNTAAPVTMTFLSLGLLFTARGLRLGHRLAWAATMAMLAVSIGVHMAHRPDISPQILPILGTAWLAIRYRAFAVRPHRTTTVKAVALVASVATVVVIGGTALAWNAGSRDLDASMLSILQHLVGLTAVPLGFGYHFLNSALTIIGLVLMSVTLWIVLSPRRIGRFANRISNRERAREIVAAHGQGTLDYFALRDDKRWFFHGDSLVAYAVTAGVCLVSPDPIGPAEERRVVWTQFMAFAQSNGWTITILGASEQWLDLYQSFDLHPVYLGEEAIIDASTFTLEGPTMRNLRQTCNRVRRNGYTVTFHDPTELDTDERRDVLALADMGREGTVERGFSMTLSRLFDAADTGLMMSIARDADGHIQAFIQWTPAPGINGWSLDVMRRNTKADLPNGVMDFLITETAAHLKSRGEVGLGLNFAVLRNTTTREASMTTSRYGGRAIEVLSGRTQIDSLGKYNEKFHPGWQPRYVVFGNWGSVAKQGLVMASAEGLSELPLIGRFMTGMDK